MKKAKNTESQETKNERPKSNYYSRRSFYLNKRKKQENKVETIEPKQEQIIVVTKKIIKKTKEKKPYVHHSHPKLKLNSITFEENITKNDMLQIKKCNSYKIIISIETIQNKILSSNNKIEKKNKIKNKEKNEEQLNKSNSLKNISVQIKSSNVNSDTSTNNENKNQKKITINLKPNNNYLINKNKPSNETNSIKLDTKINKIHTYKSPDNTHLKSKININANAPQKNTTKTNKYVTTNINIVSTKTNVTKNVVEVKKNKTQQKMDMLKSQGKSLLLGAPKKECTICHKYIETHLLKIHMNVHFSQILHWLYLGNFENAQDIKELRRNNITNILNCAIECKNKTLPKSITELHLDVRDEPEFYIIKYFEKSNEFINKVRTEGGSILVHCKMGLSRSPSFIIAFLIKYYGFTVDSAINFLKRKRPYVNINHGFIQQLHEYEKTFKKKAEK